MGSADLEQRLKDLTFPKFDRTKIQDYEIIQIAEDAINIVGEIDQWFFDLSRFEPSNLLSKKNYRAAYESSEEDDIDEDMEDLEDEIDRDSEEDEQEELDDLLLKKEQEMLDKMDDTKFLNKKKPQTKLESLQSWLDEYKFISENGRHSLAEQTKRFKKVHSDYHVKRGTEKMDLQRRELQAGFIVNEILKVGRHCKVTKGGRITSYSTLVLVGTGKGTAGFGYGKGMTAADATSRAFKDAERNLVSVPLYRGGLACGFDVRKRGSFLRVWTKAPCANRTMNYDQSGLITNPLSSVFLEAFGFNNTALRTWKRRNWHNMLEGYFETIPLFATHPEDSARKMGLKLKILGQDERIDQLKPHFT